MPIATFTPPSALTKPAAQALALQCIGVVSMLALQVALWRIRHVSIMPMTLAVGVGSVAALLSYWRGMRWWWWPLQFVFAPALLAASSLSISPWFYLLLFLLLLTVYWRTYQTQVPLYLSGQVVWDAVIAHIPPGAKQVIDIGSGIGGLVLHLAASRPEWIVSGIELAPLPWLVSRLRARQRCSPARLMRGDYHSLDFSAYDVVFAYLSPAAMPALWLKASAEMRPGTLLLSYEFTIDDHPPDFSSQPRAGARYLYGWVHR